MATTDRGKAIFENLEEYPLPKKDGVRDYIFYLVPSEATHGYGWSARAFFRKWYRNHAEHEVTSLAGLIDALHADVTAPNGVQQIREIVIVAHANAQAMLFPILDGADAATHSLPYVNQVTLARLQALFRGGDLKPFSDKRKAVVAHLSANSWVTIRGCNFGNSHDGMYATYSFFGGQADVYAPKLFQHFGVYIMSEFARLNTPEKLHLHLVRQHFFPKDVTPARKKALIQDLVDAGVSSAPFTLATAAVDNPTPAEKAAYDGLVDALNKGTRSTALLSKLSDLMTSLSVPDWDLSESAEIKLVSRWPRWRVSDGLTHDNIRYRLYIDVSEDLADRTLTLSAQARLSVDHDDRGWEDPSRLQVIIQLFLNEEEDAIIHGRLFRLAGFTDEDQEQTRATLFWGIRNLLDANKYSDPATPAIDLRAAFESRLNTTLPDQPDIRLETPAVSDMAHALDPASWLIYDANNKNYRIKLERPSTLQGVQAHTISVYIVGDEERSNNEVTYLADHVVNSDTPGTELAAYFDRLTIDDLLAVIEYLRTPFKPGNALYIDQAQQAIKRKEGFDDWRKEKHPEFYDPSGTQLLDDSEWELRAAERDDKRESSYEFDFNATWCEVKASLPSAAVAQDDLFTTEDLAQKLNLAADGPLNDAPDTDSAAIDFRARTAFETPFATHPSASDKSIFDEPEDLSTANCQEFEAVIGQAMAVKDADAEQIKALLEQQHTLGGKSFIDVLLPVLKGYSSIRSMANYTELFPLRLDADRVLKLPWVPSSPEGLVMEPIKRVLDWNLKAELSWWLAGEGETLVSTTMLNVGLASLWTVSLALVPGKSLYQIVKDWTAADQAWEALGEATAIRQWLRRVEDVTYLATSVPDLLAIDVSTPVSTMPFYDQLPFANEPYYIGRFYLELYEEDQGWNLPVNAPDRMKSGFDAGVVVMKYKVVDELMHRAERGVNELLKQWQLDACQIRVLTNAGILTVEGLKAQLIGELAGALREKLPRL